MPIEILRTLDFESWDQPDPTAEPRQLMEEWLRYQRHEFLRKLRDLDPDGLVEWSIRPLDTSWSTETTTTPVDL